MDSSPQGGLDWALSGAVVMMVKELAISFGVCEEDGAEDTREAMKTLHGLLQMQHGFRPLSAPAALRLSTSSMQSFTRCVCSARIGARSSHC